MKPLLLLFFLAACCNAAAQVPHFSRVTGMVEDAATNQPLYGATIKVILLADSLKENYTYTDMDPVAITELR